MPDNGGVPGLLPGGVSDAGVLSLKIKIFQLAE